MILNGKTYKLPELDFNAMCALEEKGVNLMHMDSSMLMLVRGIIALAMDTDLDSAGRELEAHLINGGRLEVITEEINKAVTDSGFFQALIKSQKTGNTQSKGKKEAKAE